ncbi:putative cytochrome P450 [Clohesyomyces aquaticus]|uniref:Putative cytochrome P450 n=1 Tax=Clohesyomyces aquaticus TaxID=1231657 RepID=A0A1Y1Z459_9PLEO|nr:putative cytochrome P450 [Clohesyomyces aquaticus]
MISQRGLLAALAGVATHIFYFNRSEHHMKAAIYILLLFTVASLHITQGITSHSLPPQASLSSTLTLITPFFTGLYTSLILYRLFLHPLRTFPGPLCARLSDLWFSLQVSKILDAHQQLLALHSKHGDFVRIGSSELSIKNYRSVEVIYGPQSKCTKADWYDLTLPLVSIHTTRDRAVHDQRRRVWSGAFGEKNLRVYEERITGVQEQLVRVLEGKAKRQKAVEVTELFRMYSFDVIGDLAFGQSFDMLKSDEFSWVLGVVDEAMMPLGMMLPMWVYRLLTIVPMALNGWRRFIGFVYQRVDDRLNKKVKVPTSDILSTLLNPYGGRKPSDTELNILRGDAQLILIAGSDTTATTLSSILYELVKSPSHITLLRKEISPHVRPNGEIPHHSLQNLSHLNAVISETLRLHPPAGAGLKRKTPPEGLVIGSIHVPGNVTVSCPQYVIGRDEAIYVDAKSFIPARWTISSELVKEKEAYVPFSMGPYNCIGKSLALMNIRLTIAKLIMQYEIRLAEGEDALEFERGAKTYFTTCPGRLCLQFTRRE